MAKHHVNQVESSGKITGGLFLFVFPTLSLPLNLHPSLTSNPGILREVNQRKPENSTSGEVIHRPY